MYWKVVNVCALTYKKQLKKFFYKIEWVFYVAEICEAIREYYLFAII
jgi:hypothetical protein